MPDIVTFGDYPDIIVLDMKVWKRHILRTVHVQCSNLLFSLRVGTSGQYHACMQTGQDKSDYLPVKHRVVGIFLI